jgi:hypothetical protein
LAQTTRCRSARPCAASQVPPDVSSAEDISSHVRWRDHLRSVSVPALTSAAAARAAGKGAPPARSRGRAARLALGLRTGLDVSNRSTRGSTEGRVTEAGRVPWLFAPRGPQGTDRCWRSTCRRGAWTSSRSTPKAAESFRRVGFCARTPIRAPQLEGVATLLPSFLRIDPPACDLLSLRVALGSRPVPAAVVHPPVCAHRARARSPPQASTRRSSTKRCSLRCRGRSCSSTSTCSTSRAPRRSRSCTPPRPATAAKAEQSGRVLWARSVSGDSGDTPCCGPRAGCLARRCRYERGYECVMSFDDVLCQRE